MGTNYTRFSVYMGNNYTRFSKNVEFSVLIGQSQARGNANVLSFESSCRSIKRPRVESLQLLSNFTISWELDVKRSSGAMGDATKPDDVSVTVKNDLVPGIAYSHLSLQTNSSDQPLISTPQQPCCRSPRMLFVY